MKSPNFFSELKRRNVYKVAVAYIVAGWALAQGLAQVLPVFDVPLWIIRLIVLLIIVGFPVAVICAWVFEITPEGLKRTEEVDATVPNRRRSHLWIYVVVVGAAASLGLFFLGRYTALKKIGPQADEFSAKSIAVLPFENLSRDPENVYFSEGIQDEILSRLAKLGDLKVVSPPQPTTSGLGNPRELAKELRVSNFLRGSVQKSGDQVRVNVQLVNADTDAHLWGESYDRKLNDIFGVESEIARTVAETLQAKLTGSAEQVLAARPTENPEAHQLYLKGRYFWNRRTEENMRRAISYFQEAIEKDPSYALAYAGLADGYSLMPIYSANPPREDIRRAVAAAHRALELDSTLAEAHCSLGNALTDDLQFSEAEEEFKRAIELNPNYPTAHQWYGECLQAQGRFDEALSELQKAHELDPLSLIINAVLASNLGTAGHGDQAIQQFQRTLELDPSFGPAQFMLGQIYEGNGDFKQAAIAYDKAAALNPTPIRRAMVARMDVQQGKAGEARKILDDLTSLAQRQYVQPYPLALIHLALGEKEEALALLEKAYEDRSIQIGGNTGSLKIDRRLDPLRGDPRFDTLVKKYLGPTK